ncbi:AAHS family 3-hydroxyphenylpropionic acid transporter [Paraburkholderia bannensis]|uniref:AAHS family 3-hydroxyphenylpropionic acid transporter n=1 Tax=Paraburkholderia bannensis TaxID=765414 RepID=A0A7W9TZB5_9BURK|nr:MULTISPECIES: 3-(3-hydroxy-phenyl)propionate transporter MhpT [Paraburkholderia]MBB3259148.1 AAHS family 3-hydroxyphenylpropionic acid transporter [Paraburkholderia sp. WP4_3_2]MBB6104163.1 AAHS family 3-hydroxyphenylpropionic acid transporter [Paraburkholderia bannensis]
MSSSTTQAPSSRTAATAWVLGLCLVVAVLEGLDLQSTGVAAPRMAREFGLSVRQLGIAFSAGMFGLLPGAMLGGRLADLVGRKRVLLISMVAFGAFSLLTAQTSTFATLLIARLLTGLGLGGAMPNLIALSAEAVPQRLRNTAVSIMYCGMPLGGALAALIGVLSAGDTEWRHIFYAGGFGPLLIAPAILAWLPESRAYAAASANAQAMHGGPPSTWRVLFGEGRATVTAQIWISFFCTLIVLYFLLNWLPSLIVSRGLTRSQAGVTQILFNVGSVIGVLATGTLMDRVRPVRVVGAVYAGIAVSLFMLAGASNMLWLSLSVLLAGMGVVGAQSMLYALSATSYDTVMRGTGVGAAVAAGRIGSIVGPLAAGQLLAGGASATTVIAASIPVTVAAAIGALLAVRRSKT